MREHMYELAALVSALNVKHNYPSLYGFLGLKIREKRENASLWEFIHPSDTCMLFKLYTFRLF